MISCPNCGKSVADDAVHCGHCGHKIELVTNQKTMMGFSLSPEDLQKAIAEAGQQRAAQSAAVAQAEPVELARTEILPSLDTNPALSDTLDPESDIAAEAEQLAAGSPFGSSPGFGNSPGFGSMEPKSDVSGGFAGAPSVHDPFSQPAAAPVQQSITPMQQSTLQTSFPGNGDGAGEGSFIEKNKKLLIIGGAVAVLLFGCCVVGIVLQFVM